MFLLVLLLICVSPGVIKVYQKRSTQTRDNYISNDVILLNARDRIGPVRFRKLFCTSRNWNYIYIYTYINLKYPSLFRLRSKIEFFTSGHKYLTRGSRIFNANEATDACDPHFHQAPLYLSLPPGGGRYRKLLQQIEF